MRIKPIKTKKDHKEALATVANLMDQSPKPGSKEDGDISVLVTLIKDYESKKFPTGFPGPIAAIKFRMEQQGLKQVDLVPYLGSRSRVSEVLSGKRSLTTEMIRNLNQGLGIPLKSLVWETDISKIKKKKQPQQQSAFMVRDMD